MLQNKEKAVLLKKYPIMQKNRIVILMLTMFSVLTAYAQYPSLTKAERDRDHYIDSITKAHSDSAWQVAWPIVEKEAREGRPFIPWASRSSDLPQADIPAFPGAEGGGMYTCGGRGGKVLTVTNLNDDGPGSFRWACEQGGARIIVFNVSGNIRLKTPVVIRAPYVTIAGQTAPGEGVQISGESVWIDTHDVIVRHMRFRRGENDVARRDDCLGGNPVGNIMLDHLSCAFGLDENISFYRHMYHQGGNHPDLKLPTVNVTIQNSISAKALDTYNHSFGAIIGGVNNAFIRNLWSCNGGRNPRSGSSGVFNFVNNVVYNWTHRTVDGGDWMTFFNVYNNYFKPGPATPKTGAISHRIIKTEMNLSPEKVKRYGHVYCEGNIMEGFPAITADNWKGGVQIESLEDVGDEEANIRWNKPYTHPYYQVMSATEAYDYVLENAGATLPCRDELDRKIVEEVRTGKPFYAADAQPDSYQFKYRRMPKDSWTIGIITDIQQIGGLPVYKKWKPYVDTDNDGMPDEWEKAHGLNPRDASDANKDSVGDGYTNIERYINGIGGK